MKKKTMLSITAIVLAGAVMMAPLSVLSSERGGGPPAHAGGGNQVTDEDGGETLNRGQQMRAERQEWQAELREARAESKEAFHAILDEKKDQVREQRVELEESGDLDGAFEAQTDLVKMDLKDRSEYKALGHLFDRRSEAPGLKVFVNGDHPVFDAPPVIREGRTLIPMRAVSNSLKADSIDWDSEERKVTITKGDLTVELFIGEGTAFINGEEVTIDAPPEINEKRTFVPLRFISQAFGAFVDYDNESKSAIIVDEEDEEEDIEEDESEEEVTEDEETAEEEPVEEEVDEE